VQKSLRATDLKHGGGFIYIPITIQTSYASAIQRSYANVLRISVMYLMSRVKILHRRVGRWNGSYLVCSKVYQWYAVRASKACPPSHTLPSSLQHFMVTTSVLFISPCFFLAAPLFTRVGLCRSLQ